MFSVCIYFGRSRQMKEDGNIGFRLLFYLCPGRPRKNRLTPAGQAVFAVQIDMRSGAGSVAGLPVEGIAHDEGHHGGQRAHDAHRRLQVVGGPHGQTAVGGHHRGRLKDHIGQGQEQGGAQTEEEQSIQNLFHLVTLQ